MRFRRRPGRARTAACGRRTPTASCCRRLHQPGDRPLRRRPCPAPSYTWHNAPDGGACFADGTGWIYVSNSEISRGAGGAQRDAGSTRSGAITGAYRILSGTNAELRRRRDPVEHLAVLRGGRPRATSTRPTRAAARRPSGGPRWAASSTRRPPCDPVRQVIYLTEDETDGCFYRFVPTTWGDLSAGTLQVLRAGPAPSGTVTWANVPDPDGSPDRAPATRSRGAKRFNGGEGCYYAQRHRAGSPPRATTGSGSYNARQQHHRARLRRLLVDRRRAPLTGVDNITGTPVRRPVRRRGRRQHGDLHHHPGRHRRAVPADHRPVRLRDHRSGLHPRRQPPLLLLPARHERLHRRGGITYEVTGPFRTSL